MRDVDRFIPTSQSEMEDRGWSELDILFISGDAYIDHPAFGVALLARLLEGEGYRVGILAQPDWRNPAALQLLGRPRLFAAISAGAMDSMVNHYTAAGKRRNDDAYTPGGKGGARPNRATIAYTAAIKGALRGVPVVIGGIEASLRRLAHYDYWEDTVRRSILVDSKADLLLYGMAESAFLEVARRAAAGEAIDAMTDIRGTAILRRECPPNSVILPAFEAVKEDRSAFAAAFQLAENELNPYSAQPLAQKVGDRWLVVNPPSLPLEQSELDRIYALPFTRLPHPSYRENIPAFEQIRTSVTTHRGCYGGCSFCALTSHQGKSIQSRSVASIVDEVHRIAASPGFRGTISDLGGPSANMYGTGCKSVSASQRCRRPSCLWPIRCENLHGSDAAALRLLDEASAIPKVKHLFVASGIRFDLMEDQREYGRRIINRHVSGLMKVAPESLSPTTLKLMRKPSAEVFFDFLKTFRDETRRAEKRQGVVPYLMAGHPGSTLNDMIDTALLLKEHGLKVEQVQEFTPTPGTRSTCIYYTGIDPETRQDIYVPRSNEERRMQKALLLWHLPENEPLVRKAFLLCGRGKDLQKLYLR